MQSYWIVNAAGDVLSKQYSYEKKRVYLGPSIVDGLGLGQDSKDFMLRPDGTQFEADIFGATYNFVSCFASAPYCPKRQLMDLLKHPTVSQSGLILGVELEFYVFPKGVSSDRKLDLGEHAYRLSRFFLFHELQAAISKLLLSLSVEKFCLHPEGSDGQFELSFGPLEPYELASKYSLVLSLLPGLAAKFGCEIFFSPRPFEGQFINALHVNFSWSALPHAEQHELATKIAERSPYYQLVYNASEESYFALDDKTIAKSRPKIEYWIATDARNSIIRHVKEDSRFEFRLPDPSANIFCVISAMILSYISTFEFAETYGKTFAPSSMNRNLSESKDSFRYMIGSAPEDERVSLMGLGGLLRHEDC